MESDLGRANGSRTAAATSRDVARELNIAQSTVSRAFTPGASISPGLRARIHKTAERLGYRPNLLARSLIAGRSKLIAVVLARQTNLLYPELLYEFSGRLAERGYQVLLFPTEDDGAIANTIERILAYRVDGVLATGVIDEDQAQAIVAHDLPLVMFNRTFDLPISSVACDFAAGARDLVRSLVRAGHRHLGLVAGPRHSFVSSEVERGAATAVADSAGTSLTCVRMPYAYDSGSDAVESFELTRNFPSAIICVNDTVAAGCLDHLRQQRQRSVPEDVSIVTFEGSGPAGWRGYQLTGMRQPVQHMAAAAVDMLLSQITGEYHIAEHRMLAARFVEGTSARIG